MEKYLFEQSLILIPVLNVIGLIIKQLESVNNNFKRRFGPVRHSGGACDGRGGLFRPVGQTVKKVNI